MCFCVVFFFFFLLFFLFVFFNKGCTEKGQSLTLRKHISEVPKLKINCNLLTVKKRRHHLKDTWGGGGGDTG